ncbi:hypothetical protein PMAYCL1PPCAC_14088, partial [Pristionchus mayeri]
MFSFYEESLEGKTQLCPFFNEKGESFIIVNLNLMLAIDIVNAVASVLLLRYNKKTLRIDRHSYELAQTFRRVQNLRAMQQFIPMHTLHWISHIVHFGLFMRDYLRNRTYA